ncbi:SGNH/GDSL hydrolase family protein [Asanoa sp. NPDC049573]|uniref:SGNH/GDSL hydrolase family protein n=1 Tax=Asanoa sp. NPDC049573 TaxID=3155396 RepID=UPI0034437D5F
MRRAHVLDALIRLAQPANVVVLPVLIAQGRQVRRRMPRLPAAQGPTAGVCPGSEPALRLTVLGDSAAAGVGAATHEEALGGFLGAEVARRTGRMTSWHVVARSGAKTRDVTRDLVPRLVDHSDVIIAVAGVNDLKSYRLIRDFRRDTAALVDAIRRRVGPVPVVLAGIPPFEHMPGLPRPMRTVLGLRGRAMNDVLRRLASTMDNVSHISLSGLAFSDDAFTEDGFHPASNGYRMWAETIADQLGASVGAPGREAQLEHRGEPGVRVAQVDGPDLGHSP